MLARFHHVAFPSPVCLHFLFILPSFPFLFGAFCLSWASHGRQDRLKIAIRAAQEPPRSSPETPRAAQDGPKTPPRASQDSQRLQQDRFGFLLAPFCFLLAPVLASCCFPLVAFWHCFGILSCRTPTAFQRHSHNIPAASQVSAKAACMS